METAENFKVQLDYNYCGFASGLLSYQQFAKRNAAIWDAVQKAGIRDAVNDLLRNEERR